MLRRGVKRLKSGESGLVLPACVWLITPQGTKRIAVVGWLYDANDILMTPLEPVNGVSVVVVLLQVPMSGNVSDHSDQRIYVLCICKKLVVFGWNFE